MGIETSIGPEATDEREAQTPTVTAPIGVRSASLTVLAVVAAIYVLQQGQDFFIPLVLSLLISYALDPIVTWLAAHKVPRMLASAIVLALLVGLLAGGVYGLRDQFTDIVSQLPTAAQRIRTAVRQHRSMADGGSLGQVQKAATALEQAASDAAASTPAPRGVTRVQIEEPPLRVRDYLWWGSAGAVSLAGQLVSVLFLVYFMLMSGDLFKRKIVRIAGSTLSEKKLTVQILNEIDLQIERFLLVQLFTSFIVALASYVAFRFLGLQQAAIWAIAAGLFNSIPYLGPVIVTGGLLLVGLIQFGTITMAATIAGTALVITSLEGFVLTPWLTSRAASMNAVAIFVGLLFWSWVWGVWGTLLAVPMLMVLKAIADRIEDLHGIAELLGD